MWPPHSPTWGMRAPGMSLLVVAFLQSLIGSPLFRIPDAYFLFVQLFREESRRRATEGAVVIVEAPKPKPLELQDAGL